MNVRDLANRFPAVDPARMRGSPAARPSSASEDAPGTFSDALEHAEEQRLELKLSAHAEHRISQRGIELGAEQRNSLGEALYRAEAKGAENTLMLGSEAAFLVNVPSRTVITALALDEMTNKVFTNIDSTVLF